MLAMRGHSLPAYAIANDSSNFSSSSGAINSSSNFNNSTNLPRATRKAHSRFRKRWAKESFPLRLCVGNETGLAANEEILQEIVIAALEKWREASNGLVSYRVVDVPTAANLYICIRATSAPNLGNECSGYCSKDVERHTGIIRRVQIIIPQTSGRVAEFSNEKRATLNTTLLHELGHAFGLEHSSSTRDVMYPLRLRGRNISANDRASIQRLYSEKKDAVSAK
jgi:predicted Zn-dependent protease